MAEDTTIENSEDKQDKQDKGDTKEKKKAAFPLMTVLIIAGAVVISSAMGAGLSLVLSNKQAQPQTEQTDEEQTADTKDKKDGKKNDKSDEVFYYELTPIFANLDVPGASRYVRVALTMELTFDPMGADAEKFTEKIPVLTNWLTIYLSGLSTEDIQGSKNLKRMQAQILDSFNEMLFPNEKPGIKSILFKEIAIQ